MCLQRRGKERKERTNERKEGRHVSQISHVVSCLPVNMIDFWEEITVVLCVFSAFFSVASSLPALDSLICFHLFHLWFETFLNSLFSSLICHSFRLVKTNSSQAGGDRSCQERARGGKTSVYHHGDELFKSTTNHGRRRSVRRSIRHPCSCEWQRYDQWTLQLPILQSLSLQSKSWIFKTSNHLDGRREFNYYSFILIGLLFWTLVLLSRN